MTKETAGIDFVLVAQSEAIRYEEYSAMPVERIDLYRNLVQLRMVYHDGGFRSHLDLFNKAAFGRYFFESPYEDRRDLFSIWNLPALNAVAIVNPLERAGYHCRIINNFDAEFDLLVDHSSSESRPVIGISTTFILQWAEVGRIAKEIRRSVPGATIVLGGAFVNDQYLTKGAGSFEKPMRKYGIGYVLYGLNPEPDILSLMAFLRRHEGSPEETKNLAYLDVRGVFRTTAFERGKPALTDPLAFKAVLDSSTRTRTLQIRTSFGCPFRCAFCSYPSVSGGFYRADMEYVRKQLEQITEVEGIEAVLFVDDTINFPAERFREIVRTIRQFDLRWYAFYRGSHTDGDLAREMRESGCDGLYIGFESANDQVLRNMNKKATVDRYRRTVEILKKNEIPLFGMFIVGFPGETEESVEDDISFIEDSGLDFYSVKEFYYLHTAPVHQVRHEYELEGEGYRWKHATMTSAAASEQKLRIFESVNRALFVDPDLGLWYLAYLRDKGLSWEKIVSCQRLILDMVREDNKANYRDKAVLFDRFRAALRGPGAQ